MSLAAAREEYRLESIFVDDLRNQLPEYLAKRAHNFAIASEVIVGRVVADLVAVLYPKNVELPDHELTIQESVILAHLRRFGTTRIDILESRCGVGHTRLRSGSLHRLLESQLISRSPGGHIKLANTWATSVKILAIEAKIEKWNQAIQQAMSYWRYADETFVAVPKQTLPDQTTIRSSFRDDGVGLMTLTPSLRIIARAKQTLVDHDWRREFALSRIVSRSN